MHYSVPYEYLKNKVDVRMTKRAIEMFYNNLRIASHIKLSGKTGQCGTNPDTKSSNKAINLEWDY